MQRPELHLSGLGPDEMPRSRFEERERTLPGVDMADKESSPSFSRVFIYLFIYFSSEFGFAPSLIRWPRRTSAGIRRTAPQYIPGDGIIKPSGGFFLYCNWNAPCALLGKTKAKRSSTTTRAQDKGTPEEGPRARERLVYRDDLCNK